MASLSGKVAIVTGASSGIGRATARALAKEGGRAVLAARREDRLRQVAAEIEGAGGQALVVPTDVSKREAVERLVQATVDRFGRIDVLVNNAGFGLSATLEDTSEEDFRDLWEVNVMGVFHGMKAALPMMRRQRSGHIINVASAAGRIATPFEGAYAATKFAVMALTEALRAETTGSGIHVSAVLPVGTETEFFQVSRRSAGMEARPIGHVQSADQVARAIVRCIRRPTAEVLPFKSLRGGVILNAVSPAAMRMVIRRLYRRQLQEQAARVGAIES